MRLICLIPTPDHQVHGLRRAFSTLSDVFIEEVDLIRAEGLERQEELMQRMAGQAKGLKALRTEVSLLRSEAQAGRATLASKSELLEERLTSLQEDVAVVAQEVSKGSSAHHLLQLEIVELRSRLDEELRERRQAQKGQKPWRRRRRRPLTPPATPRHLPRRPRCCRPNSPHPRLNERGAPPLCLRRAEKEAAAAQHLELKALLETHIQDARTSMQVRHSSVPRIAPIRP